MKRRRAAVAWMVWGMIALGGVAGLVATMGTRVARAQEGGAPAAAADGSEKAKVRATYDAMQRMGERLAKAAKEAEENASKQSIVTLLHESFAARRRAFVETFRDSDWPTWAKGDDDAFVIAGLRTMAQVHWSEKPELARKACEMIIASAPETPYAAEAAVNIPYSIVNEEAEGALEAALEASASLAGHYSPSGRVEMRLFEGDLLTVLGRKDEALAAYESCVELAESIPRELSQERDRGELAMMEADTRLRLIGKSFPILRPLEWIGREAPEDGSELPRELEFEPGRFTVVMVGSAACRNCAWFLTVMEREKQARAEQPFDVVALRSHSRTVFLPSDARQPQVGQELYGLEMDDFGGFLRSVRAHLGLTYPIGVVDREMTRLAGASPEAHFAISVADPYGSVEFTSTSERSMRIVKYLLAQRLGEVEYPESEAAGDEDETTGTAVDVSKLTTAVELTEHDKRPLPEGPHYAADFLEVQKAYREDPSDPERARAYSTALSKFGRHREAAECLDPALEKSPDDVDLIVERAWQLLDLASQTSRNAWQPGLAHVQREEAARWVERAVAAGPDDIEALRLQVRWMLESRDVDPGEAKRIASRLVKEHPDDPRAHRALGDFWYSMASLDLEDRGAWAHVERVYGDVVRLDPEYARGWYRIGLARQWQRDTPELVRAAYRKAAELSPESDYILRQLTDSELVPDPERRMQILDELQDMHPDSQEVAWRRAIEHAVTDDVPRGIEIMDTRVTAAPTDPFLRYYRGLLKIIASPDTIPSGVDDLCDAVRLCRGVLDRRLYDSIDLQTIRIPQLTPDQKDRIWGVLFHEFPDEINAPGNAEVWFRDTQQDYVRSYVWCRRALQADPDDPMAHNDLGITFEDRRSPFFDQAKAEEAYRQAIAAAKRKGIDDPTKSLGYKNAVDNLMKLLWRQGKVDELRAYAEAELQDDPRYEDILTLTEE